MLGAIYGDKAGSIYEFGQIKKIKSIDVDHLITSNSFYSDDTIETIAIMDAIVNKRDYGEVLKEYILRYENYKPNFSPYFKTSFSPNTIKWAHGEGRCDSTGNGAMMRISPVGYLFDTEEEVLKNAYLATTPSHNSEEAVYSASIIALMIYYFRNGLDKKEVFEQLKLSANYVPFKKFNTTCSDTMNNCLYAIYNSNSFSSALRLILSMGGDTDTNACIVGSVAEAMYGMSEDEKRLAKKDLPEEFNKVLRKVYK